jgi:hypothetical protein
MMHDPILLAALLTSTVGALISGYAAVASWNERRKTKLAANDKLIFITRWTRHRLNRREQMPSVKLLNKETFLNSRTAAAAPIVIESLVPKDYLSFSPNRRSNSADWWKEELAEEDNCTPVTCSADA